MRSERIDYRLTGSILYGESINPSGSSSRLDVCSYFPGLFRDLTHYVFSGKRRHRRQ